MDKLLAPIRNFLSCDTPDTWIEIARDPKNLNVLLIDHCNCELKAAQTALYLIRKYAVDETSGQALLTWSKPYKDFIYGKQQDINQFLLNVGKKNELKKELMPKANMKAADDLIAKMVCLIKEEFHHFCQVLEIMDLRGIPYQNIRAGRYAKALMKQVRTYEPAALVDKLIIGAFIEARSCERFAKLAPYLDDELNRFYLSLLRSEARHYQDYLTLAEQVAGEDISDRVAFFAELEGQLILTPDSGFCFHSGVPV